MGEAGRRLQGRIHVPLGDYRIIRRYQRREKQQPRMPMGSERRTLPLPLNKVRSATHTSDTFVRAGVGGNGGKFRQRHKSRSVRPTLFEEMDWSAWTEDHHVARLPPKERYAVRFTSMPMLCTFNAYLTRFDMRHLCIFCCRSDIIHH